MTLPWRSFISYKILVTYLFRLCCTTSVDGLLWLHANGLLKRGSSHFWPMFLKVQFDRGAYKETGKLNIFAKLLLDPKLEPFLFGLFLRSPHYHLNFWRTWLQEGPHQSDALFGFARGVSPAQWYSITVARCHLFCIRECVATTEFCWRNLRSRQPPEYVTSHKPI